MEKWPGCIYKNSTSGCQANEQYLACNCCVWVSATGLILFTPMSFPIVYQSEAIARRGNIYARHILVGFRLEMSRIYRQEMHKCCNKVVDINAFYFKFLEKYQNLMLEILSYKSIKSYEFWQ